MGEEKSQDREIKSWRNNNNKVKNYGKKRAKKVRRVGKLNQN